MGLRDGFSYDEDRGDVRRDTLSLLLLIAGLVVGGGAARVTGTGAGRAAGGARMPELAPPGLPLPNGLQRREASTYCSPLVHSLSVPGSHRIVIVSSSVIGIEEFLKPLHEFEVILKFAFD